MLVPQVLPLLPALPDSNSSPRVAVLHPSIVSSIDTINVHSHTCWLSKGGLVEAQRSASVTDIPTTPERPAPLAARGAGSVLSLVAAEPREQLTRECDPITVSVTVRMTAQRAQEV